MAFVVKIDPPGDNLMGKLDMVLSISGRPVPSASLSPTLPRDFPSSIPMISTPSHDDSAANARKFHLHLISDSSGETINSVARAALSQFDNVEPIEHFWNLVRTERQLALVIEEIERSPGLVMMTLVDDNLRMKLTERCRELQLPCVPVLDPVMNALGLYLDQERHSEPGRQHALDAAYFHRIEAMDFALSNDDGQMGQRLKEADVVLVGVSRTSKTPTCIYLGNRAVKAANIPYVPGAPLPEDLHTVTKPLIVGLTKDPDRLVQIRQQRLRMLNQGNDTDYVDPDKVRAEVLEARRHFAKHKWPVIDVTRRSIEETAAEIMMLLSRRRAKMASGDGGSPTADQADH
ncbi:MAG: pyruvate, water dikinase regulatory protein [Pseudomonadota bacterium]